MKNDDDEMRAPPHLVGPTGKFPKGKLTEQDEGQLSLAIRAFPKRGVIAIDFGKKIAWLALEKDNALEMARALLIAASELP